MSEYVRKKNIYAVVATLVSVTGSCASSSPSSGDSPEHVARSKPSFAVAIADTGSGKAKDTPMKTSGLTFQIGFIESDTLVDIHCVRLAAEGTCYSKTDFQAALPADLVKRTKADPALLVRLIESLHWLDGTSVHSKEIVSNRDSTDKQIALWTGSEGVLRREMWRASRGVLAPNSKDLLPPRWKDKTLTWTRLSKKLDWETKVTTISATSHQVDFDKPLSIATDTSIVSKSADLKSERERVYNVFGGNVGGFFTIEITDASKLMVAMDPAKGSARFVFTTQGAANQTIATWENVARLLPKGSESQVLANLLTGLSRFLGGSSYITIEDAAAYKKEYKQKGWDTLELSYWVDEVAVSEFKIPEFDTISDPTVTNGKLVLFFLPTTRSTGGGREPHRLAIDLHSLGQSLVLRGTAMATSEVVSDTGGQFGQPAEGPEALSPSPPRRKKRR